MARIVLYPAIALVAAQTAGVQNLSNWRQQPLNPEVFARPFPIGEQQFFATGLQGNIPTPATPHGWEGQQLDKQFSKPFPVTEQQYYAGVPEHVTAAEDSQGFYPQPPDVFAKPFPASSQQFQTTVYGKVNSTFPDGWRHPEWDYKFAKPFPHGAQQFQTTVYGKVAPSVYPDGWRSLQWEYKFAVPFPAASQQFGAQTPQRILASLNFQFYPWPEPSFAKPFPIQDQPFTTAPEPEPFPPPNGWWGYQFEYQFAKPFPVTEQLFSVWDLVGDVPLFKPPGAGKRRDFPSYIPQPAYEAKKNKPFRPVWDKPKQGEVEEHPKPALPAGPPPLPPPSIFGGQPAAPQASSLDLSAMPSFGHLVPPDPAGLAKRMQEAQDMSDAETILRKLGILK